MDLRWNDTELEARFQAYVDGLAQCLGHKDREEPFRRYCTGLLLPGERKSVEPMAARLSPASVSAEHQSLLHFVGQSPWSSQSLLAAVRHAVLPALTMRGPIEAWIVDDTSFPKKGRHSVGVARQYSGQLGKQDNCQVAVSVSVASAEASLSVAWRLYLPELWCPDRVRRHKAKVPEEIAFRSKPQIALEQIRALAGDPTVPRGVVLADAGYGNDTGFRQALADLGLEYVAGVLSSTSVWPPGSAPLPPSGRRPGGGRVGRRIRRTPTHKPLSVKALAASLAADHWHQVCWRQGTTAEPLCSRFAALRVRPAHHDWKRSQPWPEAWLIIEWPDGEAEPSKYWLSNLPPKSTRKRLVYLAKQPWLIERDYRELKQELGLGHYEGRGWPGLHHHAAMAVAAYGFLLTERMAIPPSAAHQRPVVEEPALSQCSRPRGAPGTDPAPSARLHRHDLSKDRHNPGTEDAAMSVLSAKNTETANSKRALVTQ